MHKLLARQIQKYLGHLSSDEKNQLSGDARKVCCHDEQVREEVEASDREQQTDHANGYTKCISGFHCECRGKEVGRLRAVIDLDYSPRLRST